MAFLPFPGLSDFDCRTCLLCTLDPYLQGDSKVLDTFVLPIYSICLKEHRKNITTRLKLRFWSLCEWVRKISIWAKKIRCGFKRKKSPVFTFFDELFSARKFWETFIAGYKSDFVCDFMCNFVCDLTADDAIPCPTRNCYRLHVACDIAWRFAEQFGARNGIAHQIASAIWCKKPIESNSCRTPNRRYSTSQLKSAGKNRLFFFLFDVFAFSRNSGRLTDF
jgi:hypothetical protein